MSKTLVIGFGNLYRRDDGVGFVTVNGLRAQLSRQPLGEEEDGLDELGHDLDTVVLHQLVPEFAEVVAGCDLVVFVDAHMGAIREEVREEQLVACYKPATVSHQLHPCTVLAMAGDLFGCCVHGVLLSVKGHDFDFGDQLSPQTAALVLEAVDRVLALAAEAE